MSPGELQAGAAAVLGVVAEARTEAGVGDQVWREAYVDRACYGTLPVEVAVVGGNGELLVVGQEAATHRDRQSHAGIRVPDPAIELVELAEDRPAVACQVTSRVGCHDLQRTRLPG